MEIVALQRRTSGLLLLALLLKLEQLLPPEVQGVELGLVWVEIDRRVREQMRMCRVRKR